MNLGPETVGIIALPGLVSSSCAGRVLEQFGTPMYKRPRVVKMHVLVLSHSVSVLSKFSTVHALHWLPFLERSPYYLPLLQDCAAYRICSGLAAS